MADEDEEEGWDGWRQQEYGGSPEDDSQGQTKQRLRWSEGNREPQLEDDQMSVDENSVSPTESEEETTLCGASWKKVAIGSLMIAAVCAIVAVILYTEGSRMKRELLSKKVALDYAFHNYNKVSDSMQREIKQTECARYEDTFMNWLQSFCKIINCTSDLCHKYWTPYKGHCYYFSKSILGWEESRQNCILQGAELLVIHSEEEQEFVAGFNLSRAYWIGIKDNPVESSWMWVDGTFLHSDEMFWDQGNPDSYFDYDLEAFKNCVMLRKATWANAVCSSPHYWICKRRSEPIPIKL
ncbi:CD209 antigen-like protein A [Scyliorhinus torazame]|uniref:CD209 antigen-like protein A n=1 Tax=Scyliorhinus torazame TaxID=75743 RepID=UPI003B5CEC66